MIHGPLCEDGTIQGLLEIANLPYVGCGVLASAIGMDKDVSKRLVKQAGILTSPHIAIKYSEWKTILSYAANGIHKALTYPLFVKPSNAGSSVGVQKVKHKNALFYCNQFCFQYDTKIVVEQGIDAIEIELAVLQSISGQEPIVSVPGEVRPTSRHEFYSYESKYLDENGVELLIPAPISPALAEQAKQHAKDIFMALECEGMARVDLFIERHTNEIYFNEINSIPGFTDVSMYPKLMVASGISYTDLLSQLILLAIKRHEAKTNLAREYISS